MSTLLNHYDMCRWHEVKISFGTLVDHERSAMDWFCYVDALHRLGQLDHAWIAITEALLRYPNAPQLIDLFDCVMIWNAGEPEQYFSHRGGILLDKIGPQHANDFLHQFRDSSIAQWCRLPTMETMPEWLNWYTEEVSSPGRKNFAAIAEGYGFVGSVGVTESPAAAMLHYWIGADYQGLGLGRSLVNSTLEYFDVRSVPIVFALVQRDNQRSLRLLDRTGFEFLVEGAYPNDDCIFLYRDTGINRTVAMKQLIDFDAYTGGCVRPNIIISSRIEPLEVAA